MGFRRAAWLGMVLLLAAAGTAEAQQTRLTVYTALENDLVDRYRSAFEAANPDIKLEVLRAPAGELVARLLAERHNRQADVAWIVAASTLAAVAAAGMLEPYAPEGVEGLDPRFVDDADPPQWVGQRILATALCFNRIEAEKRGLPVPRRWEDLLDPVYAGQIVMADAMSSGVGFFTIAGVLQHFGEEKGWAYLEALDRNIALYSETPGRSCKLAAAGEYAIGISHEARATRTKTDGAPIEVVVFPGQVGWDIEVAAILKGTEKLAAAQRLLDWSVSEAAMRLYAETTTIVPMPGIEGASGIAEIGDMLMPYDIERAGIERERIIEEWRKRFEARVTQE